MRFSSLRTPAGLVTAVTVALVMACGDSPAEPSAGADNAAARQGNDDPLKVKKGDVQFVRVKSDGTLVGGTALSAAKLATGAYAITFEPPIGDCAATANTASFLGFDSSVFRIVAHLSIGFDANGQFDDETVVVNTFRPSDGTNADTSFALILVCP